MILDDLRRQIVKGKLRPGKRLPTRRNLCEHYDASPQTVQLALNTLSREGFIESRGTHGTFVVPKPPHLARYAVIFSGLPGAPGTPRFWTALANEVTRLQQNHGVHILPFVNINGRRDNEDFVTLSREVSQHCFAGLIFIGPPWDIENTPVVDEPGIPRLTIAGSVSNRKDFSTIHTDNQSLFIKALDHFAARGRKRLSVICQHGLCPESKQLLDWDKDIFPAIAARGMIIKPYWIQSPTQGNPEAIRRLVHLLLGANPADRPDALFITDDNFVEHATAGIISAGLRVPQELEVVAHCNFPWPAPSVLPVRRLGFDCRAMMHLALDTLVQQRQKKARPVHIAMQACFEDEIPY